ncbi:hypothetical protein [Hymenobacter latericus]|uniref:hypothetical protein n=1 Tax=Hymenobacter sp. YIM 151858-1 TaxID=2987688 RepID=UPI002225D557|nr:hypothetical protein [Hymenobacter sp. YIM 151858-1]UYZ60124.1 hypothetical protein OIS50_04810 [Hymenobacter sp. YIM 151858-1]
MLNAAAALLAQTYARHRARPDLHGASEAFYRFWLRLASARAALKEGNNVAAAQHLKRLPAPRVAAAELTTPAQGWPWLQPGVSYELKAQEATVYADLQAGPGQALTARFRRPQDPTWRACGVTQAAVRATIAVPLTAADGLYEVEVRVSSAVAARLFIPVYRRVEQQVRAQVRRYTALQVAKPQRLPDADAERLALHRALLAAADLGQPEKAAVYAAALAALPGEATPTALSHLAP